VKTLALILAGALALPLGATELPPINTPATTDNFPGKFVWADLFTADQAAAAQFYTGLFDWTATTVERENGQGLHDYIVLSNGDRPIAGIARLRPGKMPGPAHGRWVHYISVPDVAAALSAAVAGGGHVVFPAKDLPARGTQAIYSDGEGALVGVIHSSSGDPGEYRPDPGDWTWAELFAHDPSAAALSYRTALGFEVLPDSRLQRPDTFLLSSGGFARASVVPLYSRSQGKPAWLGFVRVANLKDVLSRAGRLGGRILVGPRALDPDTQLAIIADPVGAAIGLVEHADAAPANADSLPPKP
jgi:predicted enzyme related to lactoylglutathione lyase